MSLNWPTIPQEGITDWNDREDLPEGNWLCILSEFSPTPIRKDKEGERRNYVIFRFEEVRSDLKPGRGKPFFIWVDDAGQPLQTRQGYGQWNMLLTALKVPRTVEHYPLDKLLMRPIRVLIGPEKNGNYYITDLHPASAEDEELCLSYCEQYHPV